jgi:hypothetical protein
MRTALAFLCVFLMPLSGSAQTPPQETESTSAGDFGDLPVPSWGRAVIESFEKPLHPVVGGVASGGGIGAGLGYDSPDSERWFQEAEAIVTVRRSWLVAGEVGRRSLSRRSQIGVFAGIRNMNRIGLGPGARFDDRSAFRLRESIFGTRGWYRPTTAVRVGGSVSMYFPDLANGRHAGIRALDAVFSEATAPGLTAEPTFGRFRTFAEYITPAPASYDVALLDGFNSYRGAYQVAFEAIRDFDTGRHDFHRWELETQQRLPGLVEGQRLTLHGFIASTNPDAAVPFYMLYTLGGAGGLRSFRPDMLGSDGTDATLRGFRSYRFRDRSLVLLQAEYRIPLHERIHATVFVDSGQVAPRPAELFEDLRTTTGFSLSYMRGRRTIGRMDVGFAGGEGIHVSWSFGAFD